MNEQEIFEENNGVTLTELPDSIREELPEQMLLYDWGGAVLDENE